MTGWVLLSLAAGIGLGVVLCSQLETEQAGGAGGQDAGGGGSGSSVSLPKPAGDGAVSVEKALFERRSHRSFSREALSISEVGQMLFATQGISDERRSYRTAPSAGATFPLDVYLFAGNVTGLSAGVYRYVPAGHELVQLSSWDHRAELRAAALGQASIEQAPAVLVITGTYERTTRRYDERGVMYTHIEAGHAGQNAYLQAAAMGLGTVAIGAFQDDAVGALLSLPGGEVPLYIMPFGRPASASR